MKNRFSKLLMCAVLVVPLFLTTGCKDETRSAMWWMPRPWEPSSWWWVPASWFDGDTGANQGSGGGSGA